MYPSSIVTLPSMEVPPDDDYQSSQWDCHNEVDPNVARRKALTRFRVPIEHGDAEEGLQRDALACNLASDMCLSD